MRLGVVPDGDTVLAAITGRLSGFTGESGQSSSPYRPPPVAVGLSESAVFAFGKDGFTCRAFLPLLTHASMSGWRLELQWLTPRSTGAYLAVQDLRELDAWWPLLKQRRDAAWMGHSRQVQVEMMWASGNMPGVNWRNEPGLTKTEFLHQLQEFVDGGPVAQSATDCGLVASPV